jgi:hypothetical protein
MKLNDRWIWWKLYKENIILTVIFSVSIGGAFYMCLTDNKWSHIAGGLAPVGFVVLWITTWFERKKL